MNNFNTIIIMSDIEAYQKEISTLNNIKLKHYQITHEKKVSGYKAVNNLTSYLHIEDVLNKFFIDDNIVGKYTRNYIQYENEIGEIILTNVKYPGTTINIKRMVDDEKNVNDEKSVDNEIPVEKTIDKSVDNYLIKKLSILQHTYYIDIGKKTHEIKSYQPIQRVFNNFAKKNKINLNGYSKKAIENDDDIIEYIIYKNKTTNDEIKITMHTECESYDEYLKID